MKSRLRLISYLLINMIVSALVAGAVLYFYDRSHPAVCVTPLTNGATILPDNSGIEVSITGIISVGTFKDERIVIQNNGTQEMVLTGWYLTDNSGLTYTFPQLTLYSGGKVQIHTASGNDTPTDLYWGYSAPIWKSGELAILYDPHAVARSFYRVP
jgi:hypothetical protein